MNKRVF